MARPLRIELSGGLYHVTSRGDRREDIYFSEDDRRAWLEVFGQVCERFNWVCHAYCQMTNHYHIVVETPEATPHHQQEESQCTRNTHRLAPRHRHAPVRHANLSDYDGESITLSVFKECEMWSSELV